jgi:omega-6 fatty acid desaturase (delta-12 desaturase)
MTSFQGTEPGRGTRPAWYRTVSRYQKPCLRAAIRQLANTFIPYTILWILMVRTIRVGGPYWMVLGMAAVAAGLHLRIFIFFHDCCHGSFFASRRANRILGYVCGILTLTPYEDWRRAHSAHHATAGDLDRRGTGDVWTMTVDEYQAAPLLTRIAYRVYRNPLAMFLIGPPIVFLVMHRFPHKGAPKRERLSAILTDLALVGILLAVALTIGLKAYALIQLPILLISGTAGVWLFYVQHQFDGVYWARHAEWDPTAAALRGSSYYRLPKVLQWFTGNIGLHHVHHVRPRIPNYNLQRCYDATAGLQAVQPLTIRRSLDSLSLNLWDEQRRRLVGFRALKTLSGES